jgi:hypothetical protein
MRLRPSKAGAVLTLALLAFAATAVLHHISLIGLQKAFGPVSAGATIAVYGCFAVVALADVLAIPATLFLGIATVAVSGRKSGSALLCAVSACLVSVANLLFWLFYCGGIPGTAQRPFP